MPANYNANEKSGQLSRSLKPKAKTPNPKLEYLYLCTLSPHTHEYPCLCTLRCPCRRSCTPPIRVATQLASRCGFWFRPLGFQGSGIKVSGFRLLELRASNQPPKHIRTCVRMVWRAPNSPSWLGCPWIGHLITSRRRDADLCTAMFGKMLFHMQPTLLLISLNILPLYNPM